MESGYIGVKREMERDEGEVGEDVKMEKEKTGTGEK